MTINKPTPSTINQIPPDSPHGLTQLYLRLYVPGTHLAIRESDHGIMYTIQKPTDTEPQSLYQSYHYAHNGVSGTYAQHWYIDNHEAHNDLSIANTRLQARTYPSLLINPDNLYVDPATAVAQHRNHVSKECYSRCVGYVEAYGPTLGAILYCIQERNHSAVVPLLSIGLTINAFIGLSQARHTLFLLTHRNGTTTFQELPSHDCLELSMHYTAPIYRCPDLICVNSDWQEVNLFNITR